VKTHLLIDVRQCGCGDSFCGECRTTEERTACGSWPTKAGFTTRDPKRVSCSKCRASQKPPARVRSFEERIAAAHPMKTGKHHLYDQAMKLVGERHDKGDLVELVNWLIMSLDEVGAWKP
jgi:hypothetical protein